jgi:predicted acylesterase/phospholipase RssA
MTKRAICLAGGGPAAGLHIGVLESLKRLGINFDIWALSCIGAWVGTVYNQARPGKEIEETNKFFHEVFRDDKSFKSFPMNTVFTPDWAGNAEALMDFLLDPANYRNAFLPREIMKSVGYTMSFLGDRKNWRKFSEGDFNRWTLNQVLAVNPAMRFLMAMVYKSHIDGRARLYYPDSTFLKDVKFESLNEPEKPFIFHNAWNLTNQELELFANKPVKDKDGKRKYYKEITAASLCACSALPFIEQTIVIDGDTYCEGALVDTVNFKSLLEDHHRPDDPLDEIWISRIVNADQIRPPQNLHDAMANLCQLFAATVGEDDVRLFKYHVREDPKWTGTIVEIQVDSDINFEWSHSNLDRGRMHGRRAANEAYDEYIKKGGEQAYGRLRVIGEKDRDQINKERKQKE